MGNYESPFARRPPIFRRHDEAADGPADADRQEQAIAAGCEQSQGDRSEERPPEASPGVPPPEHASLRGPNAASSPVAEPATADESPPADGRPQEGADQPVSDEQAAAEDEVVAEAEKILLDDFAKLEAERNDYLDQLRRIKADFDNYRKRVLRQQSEQRERAAEGLVEQLLPVLDTFEAAVSHGQGFEQVQASLISLLEKEGLERIDPQGKPFDPSEADAVAHEDGDGGPIVAEVRRPGYRWKGRGRRPAMVRVRG